MKFINNFAHRSEATKYFISWKYVKIYFKKIWYRLPSCLLLDLVNLVFYFILFYLTQIETNQLQAKKHNHLRRKPQTKGAQERMPIRGATSNKKAFEHQTLSNYLRISL